MPPHGQVNFIKKRKMFDRRAGWPMEHAAKSRKKGRSRRPETRFARRRTPFQGYRSRESGAWYRSRESGAGAGNAVRSALNALSGMPQPGERRRVSQPGQRSLVPQTRLTAVRPAHAKISKAGASPSPSRQTLMEGSAGCQDEPCFARTVFTQRARALFRRLRFTADFSSPGPHSSSGRAA